MQKTSNFLKTSQILETRISGRYAAFILTAAQGSQLASLTSFVNQIPNFDIFENWRKNFQTKYHHFQVYRFSDFRFQISGRLY